MLQFLSATVHRNRNNRQFFSNIKNQVILYKTQNFSHILAKDFCDKETDNYCRVQYNQCCGPKSGFDCISVVDLNPDPVCPNDPPQKNAIHEKLDVLLGFMLEALFGASKRSKI
jgi:hypothetical protein